MALLTTTQETPSSGGVNSVVSTVANVMTSFGALPSPVVAAHRGRHTQQGDHAGLGDQHGDAASGGLEISEGFRPRPQGVFDKLAVSVLGAHVWDLPYQGP